MLIMTYSGEHIPNVIPSKRPDTSLVGSDKKTLGTRKGKKGKKGSNRQRGVPWPPRPSNAFANVTEPVPDIGAAIKERPQVQMASPPTMPEDDRAPLLLEGNHGDPETRYHGRDIFHHVQPSHLPGDTNISELQGDAHIADDFTSANQRITDDLQKASPVQMTIDDLGEPPRSLLGQPTLLLGAQSDAESHPKSDTSGVRSGKCAAASRSKARQLNIQAPQQFRQLQDQRQMTTNISAQSLKAATNSAHTELPHQAEAVLHGISNQKGPIRVEKVQRKRRVSCNPQRPTAATSASGEEPLAQPDFEQKLEDLRKAYHADKLSRDLNVGTQISNLEREVSRLKEQIGQDTAAIAAWEEKYNGLHGNLMHLREKAKTNQKYVSGLQTDYEKLQKSASTHKDESEKVLREKIDELEDEKQSLRGQLNVTLDAVGKGQRRLKETVNELDSRLELSELKRRLLAENLSRQTCMYEEEKTKRTDLERQLLSSIQSMQHELKTHSANLIEKLETMQTSVDGVASEMNQETGVQECLGVLRELQKTPFLTLKDGQRAENMLRFTHEG
jgi:hypothetical protein